MDGLVRDFRYGWRALRRRPAFTLIAVLTLALGIAVNAAMFSVVDGVLLADLPYTDAGRLVLVRISVDGQKSLPSLSPPEVEDIRERTGVFEDAASIRDGAATLTGRGEPVQLRIGGIRWNFLDVLGVEPLLGRPFSADDGLENAASVVMLGHALWQDRFGGQRDILGSQIVLDDRPSTVVGVLPPGVELLMPREAGLPRRLDAWRPFNFDFRSAPRFRWMRGIARLKSGVSVERAQLAVDELADQLTREHAMYQNQPFEYLVRPLRADLVREVRTPVLLLFGAVGLVLLIACGNVASLLLARASEREPELVARAALGASRGRLVRQLLTEALLLAGAGAALGLLVARSLVAVLVAAAPPEIPRVDLVSLDVRALLFTLAATLGTVLVFALLPALQASRVDLSHASRVGARITGGLHRARLRRLLVAGEIALSLVLLVGAGLMVRSYLELEGVRPGFEPANVATFQLSLPDARYPEADDRSRFFKELLGRVEAQPGVEAFSGSFPLPMSGRFWTNEYAHDAASEEAWGSLESDNHVILPGYFRAIGARVLRGRSLTWDDVEQRRPVVVIDEVLARKAWPRGEAVGRQIKVAVGNERVSLDVVGVVEHVRQDHPGRDGREQTYVTPAMWPFDSLYFSVRSPLPLERVMTLVREQVGGLDPQLAVFDVRTLRGYVEEVTATQRFAMQLMAVFAALAALLAGIGLYGAIAYSVSQRHAEFGIRMAMGASPGELTRLVVRQGLALAALGVAAGSVASLMLGRLMAALLYGISPTDPATYAAITVGIVGLALLASYVPARRAARLHPARVLRSE